MISTDIMHGNGIRLELEMQCDLLPQFSEIVGGCSCARSRQLEFKANPQ